jgi:hypothetical protein
MGRILPASKTGCSAKNQRKLGRAIRRARALGFMPIWSRHPALQEVKMRLASYPIIPSYRTPRLKERFRKHRIESDDFLRQVMKSGM